MELKKNFQPLQVEKRRAQLKFYSDPDVWEAASLPTIQLLVASKARSYKLSGFQRIGMQGNCYIGDGFLGPHAVTGLIEGW